MVSATQMDYVTKATFVHLVRKFQVQMHIHALLDTFVSRDLPFQSAVQMAHMKVASIHMCVMSVWLDTTVTTLHMQLVT